MPPDLTHTGALLELDVAHTLGSVHCRVVRDAIETVILLGLDDPATKLVEDVQQVFHDTFVDTTWPACPLHHTHPLWYADGAWWCGKDRTTIAQLGELPASSRSGE